MGVSKNSGTPKWMVYFMKHPVKIDDLGGFPPIFGNIHIPRIEKNNTTHTSFGAKNHRNLDLVFPEVMAAREDATQVEIW